MKRKNYEQPSVDFKLFYANAIMDSTQSITKDEWNDYELEGDLF